MRRVSNLEIKNLMNFSPRSASASTNDLLVSAASSSPQPLTYKLGFYGAGAINNDGNTWFHQMAFNANISRLYVQNDGNTAMWDFLKALDVNNDYIITSAEVSNLKSLKVCGYSWGGISAIGFTQQIANAGTIVVGGSPGQPIQYQLQVGISVNNLVTIDPVQILNPPGTVLNNVKAYKNWYQQRGGDAIFRDTPDVLEGSPFSRLLKGTPVAVQSPLIYGSCNTRVDSPNWGSRVGSAFQIITGSTTVYTLSGNESNHDAMPWLVGADATSLLL